MISGLILTSVTQFAMHQQLRHPTAKNIYFSHQTCFPNTFAKLPYAPEYNYDLISANFEISDATIMLSYRNHRLIVRTF